MPNVEDIMKSIFYALRAEMIGDQLKNHVMWETGCSEEEFEKHYSDICNAWFKDI